MATKKKWIQSAINPAHKSFNFSDRFLISSFGRIKSLYKNRILSPYITKEGYLRITLTSHKYSNSFYLQILVARAFILNPENLPQVNHKEGIKTENMKWVLEWSTSKDNIIHAFSTGLSKTGENHGKSKLTNEQALDIFQSKEKREYLALKYNVCIATIKNIKLGKVWGYLTNKKYKKAENRTRKNLSNKDVIDIFTSREKTGLLVKRYGVSSVSINNIKRRYRFTELTKNHIKGEWSKYKI